MATRTVHLILKRSTLPATLVSIAVTPVTTIEKGLTQQFTATGTYSNASTADLTSVATWTSGTPATATIASGGLATSVAAGTTSITASYGGRTSIAVVLTISPAAVVSIAVTPSSPSIVTGTTQQFVATATYSDATTAVVTGSVTWASSSTPKATIASGGLATALTSGTTGITATLGSIVSPSVTLTLTKLPSHIYFGWMETWITDATALSTYPKYANVLALSFVNPATTYTSGSLTMGTTGWDYSDTGAAVKAAIAAIKVAQPGIKILASVGGASYTANWSSWSTTKASKIAAIVTDFGLDGVDIDYEVTTGTKATRVAAQETIIANLRSALGTEAIICFTGWSTGCYGNAGTWATASPTGTDFDTVDSSILTWAIGQSPNPVDMVNFMAYDVGIYSDTGYSELTAFDAYKHYWPTLPLCMGVEIPAESSGDGAGEHVYTTAGIATAVAYVLAHGGAGMAIWAIDKLTDAGGGASYQSATNFSQTICDALSLSRSSSTMPCDVGALPFDVPGLLTALSAVSRYTANAGITKDGSDRVTAWADQVGSNHMVEDASGTDPLWEANKINSLPAVKFAHSRSDFLKCVAFSSTMPTFSIFVVMKTISQNDYDNIICYLNDQIGNLAPEVYSGGKLGMYVQDVVPSDRCQTAGSTIANSTWYVIQFNNTGTNLEILVNNVSKATQAAGHAAQLASDNHVALGLRLDGNIADVVVFPLLSPTDAGFFYTAIAAVYGL